MQSMAAQDPKSRVTDDQRERFKKQFYSIHLPERFDAAKQVLEQYSGIPTDEVNEHVLRIVSFPPRPIRTACLTIPANVFSEIKVGPSYPSPVSANFASWSWSVH